MSASPSFQCEVCKKFTTLFNYGVPSCNACKMFFRRAIESTNFPQECQNGGNCSRCRYCRYQRCITVGMNWIAPSQRTIQLPNILQNLQALDSHRENVFLTRTAIDDLHLDEYILSDSINYIQTPPDFRPGFYDWALLNQTTSIEYMKKFELVQQLSREELKVFIKNTYMSHVMFCNALRSYSNRQEAAVYPGGVDVFPEEIKQVFQHRPVVLNKVRCSLIARLVELRITKEEFLLLSAIIICDPVSIHYSEATRQLISNHQNVFSSALLEYCQIKYQRHGPTRFINLLSLCHIINKTFFDFGHIIISFSCVQPNPQIKRVFIDLFNYVMN